MNEQIYRPVAIRSDAELTLRRRQRRRLVDVAALDTAVREGDRTVMMSSTIQMIDPEVQAARSEIRRLVERAIDELPEPLRVVFVMRAIEQLSIRETATDLGLREETVKTRLHRARRLLRDALESSLASTLTDTFPFESGRSLWSLTTPTSL